MSDRISLCGFAHYIFLSPSSSSKWAEVMPEIESPLVAMRVKPPADSYERWEAGSLVTSFGTLMQILNVCFLISSVVNKKTLSS